MLLVLAVAANAVIKTAIYHSNTARLGRGIMDDKTTNIVHTACYVAVLGVITLAYREPISAIIKDIKIWYRDMQAMMPRSISDETGKMWDEVREQLG